MNYSLVTNEELSRKPLTYFQNPDMRMSKGDVFSILDIKHITFDYALPQDWLDSFVKESGLTYPMVLSTTVFVYRGFEHGPVSCCIEVQEMLEKFYYHLND